MIKLVDNRPNPYQWDTNAEVEFDGICDQFHFANRVYGRSINVNAEQKDGKSKCLIPIQLLQTANDLNVYVFIGTAESGQTKVEHTFKVIPRNKPNDYVFTPAEQMTIEEIEKTANEAMQKSINAEKIAQSVRDDADAGLFKGDKGDKGEQGDSGVYVGSDPVPDGTRVQVDPQGDVIKIPDRTSDLINDSGFASGEVWEDIPLNQEGIITNGVLDKDTRYLEFVFDKPYKKITIEAIGDGVARTSAGVDLKLNDNIDNPEGYDLETSSPWCMADYTGQLDRFIFEFECGAFCKTNYYVQRNYNETNNQFAINGEAPREIGFSPISSINRIALVVPNAGAIGMGTKFTIKGVAL